MDPSADVVRTHAIEDRFTRFRIDDERADAPARPLEEIGARTPGRLQIVAKRRTRAAQILDRIGPTRPNELLSRCRRDNAPRLTNEMLGEHSSQPRHERRTHRKRRRGRIQRGGNDGITRTGDDPRIAADASDRVGIGAALGHEIVAVGRGDVDEGARL